MNLAGWRGWSRDRHDFSRSGNNTTLHRATLDRGTFTNVSGVAVSLPVCDGPPMAPINKLTGADGLTTVRVRAPLGVWVHAERRVCGRTGNARHPRAGGAASRGNYVALPPAVLHGMYKYDNGPQLYQTELMIMCSPLT